MSRGGARGGRGRGAFGGSGLSFSVEQLGFVRGATSGSEAALPAPVLSPPPKFPPRKTVPAPLLQGPQQDYLVAAGNDLVATFQKSMFYIGRDDIPATAKERSGSAADEDRRPPNPPLDLDWSRFPKELWPANKRKRKSFKAPAVVTPATGRKRKAAPSGGSAPSTPTKRQRKSGPAEPSSSPTKVLSALEELEKKEVAPKSDDEADGVAAGDDEDDEDEEGGGQGGEGGVDSEADDGDEELDDGTDYANNYFDNGEGYLDEDDDLDEAGGIY